jgi:hypothetical protein
MTMEGSIPFCHHAYAVYTRVHKHVYKANLVLPWMSLWTHNMGDLIALARMSLWTHNMGDLIPSIRCRAICSAQVCPQRW